MLRTTRGRPRLSRAAELKVGRPLRLCVSFLAVGCTGTKDRTHPDDGIDCFVQLIDIRSVHRGGALATPV
jgi:hypothetical protein